MEIVQRFEETDSTGRRLTVLAKLRIGKIARLPGVDRAVSASRQDGLALAVAGDPIRRVTLFAGIDHAVSADRILAGLATERRRNTRRIAGTRWITLLAGIDDAVSAGQELTVGTTLKTTGPRLRGIALFAHLDDAVSTDGRNVLAGRAADPDPRRITLLTRIDFAVAAGNELAVRTTLLARSRRRCLRRIALFTRLDDAVSADW